LHFTSPRRSIHPVCQPLHIRLLYPHSSDGALYHCRTYSGVATWSQSAPSPSPPSGALVNKQIGT
ncbi:unnamed protein product, partial [Staurois parvus]